MPDGRRAYPVFHLLAERYLGTVTTRPMRWRNAAACRPAPSAVSRARLAEIAFDQAIMLDQPWTDTLGRTHETMVGRPVAMHAMRGISAHSNGFHTCRAIHLLQMLLGAIDTPGSWRYKSPYPAADPAGPAARRQGRRSPTPMLPGMALGFPRGPEDLLLEDDGTPSASTRRFSWDAPISAHGLMHTVIANAMPAIRTRSTRCSCTWRTWRGTRR